MNNYYERRDAIPLVRRVAEYDGGPSVKVWATQLDDVTQTQAVRVVDEWVEFLSSGGGDIRELEFVSRTPKRLFAALAGQPQLDRLQLKWGDYEDLGPLEGMVGLRELHLGGASSVKSVEPLARLRAVATLRIESLRWATDLSPIAEMSGVTDLALGGDWASPRNAHLDSLAWIERMPQLKHVELHTLIVDDLDYSPLQRLPNLESVVVRKVRGMWPSFEELQATLPWWKPDA